MTKDCPWEFEQTNIRRIHHNLGYGMYINWILKSLNQRNSILVRKFRENNYFSSHTKLKGVRVSLSSVKMT